MTASPDRPDVTGLFDPELHANGKISSSSVRVGISHYRLTGTLPISVGGVPLAIDDMVLDGAREFEGRFPFNSDPNSGDTIGICVYTWTSHFILHHDKF